jgi:hypothetical protein
VQVQGRHVVSHEQHYLLSSSFCFRAARSVGGPAIADALFGRYNPGGKLPYTVYDAGYVDVSG